MLLKMCLHTYTYIYSSRPSGEPSAQPSIQPTSIPTFLNFSAAIRRVQPPREYSLMKTFLYGSAPLYSANPGQYYFEVCGAAGGTAAKANLLPGGPGGCIYVKHTIATKINIYAIVGQKGVSIDC